MDTISQARIAPLHPVLISRYTTMDQRAADAGIRLRVLYGLRTYAEQDMLWDKGRTTPGNPCKHDGVFRPVGTCPEHPFGLVVTEAKGGYSAHCFAYALDADPDNPDFQAWTPDWNAQDNRWKQILQIGRDCKLAEGATWRTFPDAPHFYPQELPATPTDAMRAAFAQGGMPAVWTIIDGLIGSAN